ncbi:hypothetical protein [Nonomuraea sp. NPDC049504]|uniref:hypothetical protein n=1 Tax=Nonomuraea sp. NPDC049504 TaxID=3154729 RepID=UPI00343A9686
MTKHDGLAGALVLRSLWTAIPVHRLTDEPDDELHAYFANRVALARYLADLGRSLDLRRSTRSQQNINTLRRTLPSPPRRRGGIHTITRKRKLR